MALIKNYTEYNRKQHSRGFSRRTPCVMLMITKMMVSLQFNMQTFVTAWNKEYSQYIYILAYTTKNIHYIFRVNFCTASCTDSRRQTRYR